MVVVEMVVVVMEVMVVLVEMVMCSDYILFIPIRTKCSSFEAKSMRSWQTSTHVFPASFLQQRFVFISGPHESLTLYCLCLSVDLMKALHYIVCVYQWTS